MIFSKNKQNSFRKREKDMGYGKRNQKKDESDNREEGWQCGTVGSSSRWNSLEGKERKSPKNMK